MNRILAASTTLLISTTSALAQHAGDILLLNRSNTLVTGKIETDGSLVQGTRVFVTEFGVFPNFTDEPGINSPVGEFNSGTTIGFTIRKALRKWDGSDFDAIPAERISMKLGPLGPIATPLSDVAVTGFSNLVASNGEFHRHYGYTLSAPASDGVYLLELELWCGNRPIANSLPFWVVFGQNADPVDLDAAGAWVQSNFANPCRADFNADGFLDFTDFDDFVAAFEAGSASADFNADGFLDFTDFDDFVAAFEGGC
jgi:hypothetical protein